MPTTSLYAEPSRHCRRSTVWLMLVAAATVAALALDAGDARGASLTALQAHLGREMSISGQSSGAYVYDISSKQVLFSSHPTVARAPASVEKLYTATTALELMGPDASLQTTVLGTGQLSSTGVWEGNLYLHGGGDPTFGSSSFIASHYGGVGTSISTLVSQLAKDGIRRVSGKILGDESMLDSLRGEPSSGYAPDPYLEGTLSALAFNRGETGSLHGAHAPASYAAHELWAALKAHAISAPAGSGQAITPPDAVTLASAPSPTITQLLGLTLPPSDNFFAETLVKDIGARYGGAGTTAAGASTVSKTLAGDFGLHPHVLDGSGLSPVDHTSPYEVVDLLSELYPTALGAVLRGDLAVAGQTGTLSERMRGTAAAGHCQAKTGTLTGVSNLAGYCQSVSGQVIAFAFFNDGISTGAAHTIQDNMAITLAGY